MNKNMVLTAIIMLGVGLGAGYGLSRFDKSSAAKVDAKMQPLFYRNPMDPTITSPVPAKDSMGMDYVPVYADEDKKSASKKILFYRNPMNPSVTSPVPAKDSMGMDYVPVYADGVSGEDVAGTVEIDPVVVHNIGVRTAVAKQTALSRTIRTVGRVDFNEERMVRLHPKVEGWIEHMRVAKTGQTVKADDILLSLYSPKLVSAQQEYVLALNNLAVLESSPFKEIKHGAQDLVNSSRERLQFLDAPEHQIRELEQSKEIKKSLHIHTPIGGTVIQIGARQGQYVTPSTELYLVVDLSQVWVYADVFEYEMPWIKVGDKAEMTVATVPGKTFKGALDYIYPYAEAKTRTVKVRLVFDNRDLLLRPETFAEVVIRSDTLEDAVVIPAAAVIRSGADTQVFIARGQGKFEPRPVTLGVESSGQVAVLDGVGVGDKVVTSAQFLLDSESKLREATAKMMDALPGAGDGRSKTDNNESMEHGGMEEKNHSDMNMTTKGDDSDKSEMLHHGAHQHD